MVKTSDGINLNLVDFSFIPNLRCNILCSFCMYDAGPQNILELDIEIARDFLVDIDWTKIRNWGFYGGEPSIDTVLYSQFMDLIPQSIPKFLITNGSWTRNTKELTSFIQFLEARALTGDKLHIYISNTTEHRLHQNQDVIDILSSSDGITIKPDDDLPRHPMGRASIENWTCTHKCLWHQQPVRMCLFPTGDILMQNCDGVYPIVGNWREGFTTLFERARNLRLRRCTPGISPNINDILKKRGNMYIEACELDTDNSNCDFSRSRDRSAK